MMKMKTMQKNPNSGQGIVSLIFLICVFFSDKYTVKAFSFPSSISSSSSFSIQKQDIPSYHRQTVALSAATSTSDDTTSSIYNDDDSQTELTSKGLLKRDRYVATNRFAVRKGKQGKFEKRWATRKSRLAVLDGFKYFHLMRRVTLNDSKDESDEITTTTTAYDEGIDDTTAQGNYVSFTIWEKKSHFSSWRKSDAFIEAHGGKSIGSFVSTLMNSALVLRGPPRPAFYDGLLVQSMTPTTIPELTDNGWRSLGDDFSNIVKNNKGVLPTECFIACNQFFVPSDNAAGFEQLWANRESKLKDCDGFIAFTMMRRDGQVKGHGVQAATSDEPTYLSTTIWKDVESFNKWRKGMAFKQAHGSKKENDNTEESKKPKQPPLWSQPPKPVFYEGALVITNKDGA